MPLVRIDLAEGKPPEYRTNIADVVYQALVEVAGAPTNDRFIVMNEHKRQNFIIDPHYIVERTDDALMIEITFNQGRTLDTKKALYRAIADGLHARVGLNADDVMIALVEVPKENWSFGRGEAQYAD